MEGEGSDKIGLPIQRKDYDLTKDTDKTDNPPEALSHDDSRFRSPAALMRQMGFDPTSSMTPLQFMTAVYNDDLEKIFKPGKRLETYKSKGGIALSYRLERPNTFTRKRL